MPNSDQDFWNIHKEIRHARIVVCGLTEVGKSTLIKAVLGKKMVRAFGNVDHNELSKLTYYQTQESKGHQPGEHDVQTALQAEDKDFIIHDSCGFEAGKQENYTAVQKFLIERREQPSFQEQVHCIW